MTFNVIFLESFYYKTTLSFGISSNRYFSLLKTSTLSFNTSKWINYLIVFKENQGGGTVKIFGSQNKSAG